MSFDETHDLTAICSVWFVERMYRMGSEGAEHSLAQMRWEYHHTQLAKMSFDETRDLTAACSVYLFEPRIDGMRARREDSTA